MATPSLRPTLRPTLKAGRVPCMARAAHSRCRARVVMLTALSLLPDGCACLRVPATPNAAGPRISRRAAGCGFFAAALASPSVAFDNGVPEMARFATEKKSGVDIPLYTPNNKMALGLQGDGKLATCNSNDDPNCFSTSGGGRQLLETWGAGTGDAMSDLVSTLKSYPPGLNGACLTPGGSSSCVDGGGFKVMSSTPNYLYVQFESLKYVWRACPRTACAQCVTHRA